VNLEKDYGTVYF